MSKYKDSYSWDKYDDGGGKRKMKKKKKPLKKKVKNGKRFPKKQSDYRKQSKRRD